MPVSYDLGTAYGKVVIDYDGQGVDRATTGVKGLSQEAQGLSQRARDVGPALRTVSNTALVMGAAITGGFALAVKSASDFEFQLSAIQAVGGLTADQMEKVSDTALRIGKDTIFSASEAALAMEELIKAGISAEDVLNGAADATVAIAASGQVALPEAAAIAAAALNQFKLGAEDLTEVADILAGAANASATGVSEIGQALSFVGPTANAAGLDIRDAATAIALFANNGIDGMRAGTALRGLISTLSSPTQQAAKQFEALGLITEENGNQFFDASGKMKPMEEVLRLLRDNLEGMTNEQLLQFADATVGRENMSSLAAIVNTSAEEFDSLVAAIDSVSAADVAAQRLNNLQGKVEELRGNMETAAIMIGNVLIPRIVDLTNFAIGLLDWFTNLDEGTQNLIVTVGLLTGGILLGVAAITRMVIVAGELKQAMIALNIVGGVTQAINNFRAGMASSAAAASVFSGAMGTLGGVVTVVTGAITRFTAALLRNPITLIAVAVAGLIAAMVALYQTSEEFRAIFEPVWEAGRKAAEQLQPVLQQISEAFMGLVDTLIQSLVPVLVALAEAFAPIIELLIGILAPILELVANILIAVLGPVLQIVGKLIEALAPIILLVLQAIEPLIDLLMMVLVPILDGLAWVLGVVADALQVAADWVNEFFKANEDGTSQATEAWDAFVGWLTDAWQAVVDFFQPTIDAIVGFFTWIGDTATAVWMGIMAVVTPVVQWFQTYVSPLIEAVVNLIAKGFNFLWSTVQWVWNGIVTAIGAALAWWQEHVAPVIQAVVDLVVAIFNYLWSVVEWVWGLIQLGIQTFLDWWNANVAPVIQTVVDLVVGFFTGLWNSVVAIWDGIMNAIGTAVDAAWQWIVDVFGPVVQWFEDTFGPIVDTVSGVFDDVIATFTDLYNNIMDFFADAGEWLLGIGEDIIGGLIAGIEGALGWLTDTLNNITNMIPEEKGPPAKDKVLLQESGSLIMQGLIAGLREEIPALQALLGGVTLGIPSSMQANIATAMMGQGGDSRTFIYNAAPGGAQISGEDELFTAMKRSKVVVPGWS